MATAGLGYWRMSVPSSAPVRALAVPVLRAQPPIAAASGSSSSSSSAARPSPCSSCMFNGKGGTQNNAGTPVGGSGSLAYITPPKPAMSLVTDAPASSSSSSGDAPAAAPARTPHDLAVFLETYGPTLALALVALLVVTLATSSRSS